MPKHRRPAPRSRYKLLALGALAIGASPLAIPAGGHGQHGSKPFPIRIQPSAEAFALPVVPMDLAAATRLLPAVAPLSNVAPATKPEAVSVLRPDSQQVLARHPAVMRFTARPSAAAATSESTLATTSRALAAALSLRGTPYVYGGNGPGGVDCSGLIVYAYRAAGIALPRTAADIATVGRPVSLSQLRPGDLIFYYAPISHVVMVLGNDQVVEVSQPGTVVHVVPMYLQGFATARRIVG